MEPVTHFERLWTPAASAILSLGNVPNASADTGTKENTAPIPNKTLDVIIVSGETCKFKFEQSAIEIPKKIKPVEIKIL